MEQPIQSTVSEEKKVHAENMRLKKQIKAMQKEIDDLKRFIGGK